MLTCIIMSHCQAATGAVQSRSSRVGAGYRLSVLVGTYGLLHAVGAPGLLLSHMVLGMVVQPTAGEADMGTCLGLRMDHPQQHEELDLIVEWDPADVACHNIMEAAASARLGEHWPDPSWWYFASARLSLRWVIHGAVILHMYTGDAKKQAASHIGAWQVVTNGKFTELRIGQQKRYDQLTKPRESPQDSRQS